MIKLNRALTDGANGELISVKDARQVLNRTQRIANDSGVYYKSITC
jgi:hypothetical protein